MKEQKKSIIVNEILFWKQNQMLPEHYCDFLLALYEQGESPGTVTAKRSILNKRPANSLIWQTVLTIVTVVAMLLMFISVSIFIPAIVMLFVSIALIIAIIYFSKQSVQIPVFYVLVAILLLGFSLKVWLLFFNDRPIVLAVIMFVNCALWMIAGKSLKLVYFLISGIGGILIIGYYLFF